VEKLRKIGQWLWRNKERIILAAVILLGVYRVYVILVSPGAEEIEPPPPAPRSVPSDWGEVPNPPETAPALPPVVDFDDVVRRNPFTYSSAQGETAPQEEQAAEADWNRLSLVRVQELPDGEARARMRYAGEGASYVSEGDSIGPFEVVDVDAEDGAVRVRHTERNQSRTLSLEGQG
jgi:hypothetical protein